MTKTYDEFGFDSEGFDKAGRDKHGYGYAGYDLSGYDISGYEFCCTLHRQVLLCQNRLCQFLLCCTPYGHILTCQTLGRHSHLYNIDTCLFRFCGLDRHGNKKPITEDDKND
jgi:hypothetical protein